MAESNTQKDAGLRPSLLIGSEVDYDITCHPCRSGGIIFEAEGYCLDCCVYLCDQCINHHKRIPALAHHQLVDKDNMPNQQNPPPVKDMCTDICQTHKDEIVKYFCSTHKVLGCTECISLNHKLCEGVAYISEVVVGLEDSQYYREFKARLEDLIQKSKDTIKYSQEGLKISNENFINVIQDIELYKHEIIEALDVIKNNLKEKASQFKAKNTSTMNSIEAEGNQVLVELESMSKDIKEQLTNKQHNKLFIQMKSTEKKLTALEKNLKEMNKTSISIYEFQKNSELQKVVERKTALGKLRLMNPKQSSAKCVAEINIKSRRNNDTCNITGTVLLSTNNLVAVDWTNKTVKLIDVYSNTILSELRTGAAPWHVTKVDRGRVAVTLPNANKILFLKYRKGKGLVSDKEISVRGQCWGIAYIPDRLVVSFYNPTQVGILSMNGEVLHTFATDNEGVGLLKGTEYVAVNALTGSIYASDCHQNCVTMLDMNGKVKAIYKDDELTFPKQLAVDTTGLMYLCGGDSHDIHILTADCKKVEILLRKTDGLEWPGSVCYCEATGRLYVGMRKNNKVKVYQLV